MTKKNLFESLSQRSSIMDIQGYKCLNFTESSKTEELNAVVLTFVYILKSRYIVKGIYIVNQSTEDTEVAIV